MFSLGEILKEAGIVDKDRVEKLSIWSYEEEKYWNFLEPESKPWNIKSMRPLIVIGDDSKYVYLIMTSSTDVYCTNYYSVDRKIFEIDLDLCEIETSRKCKWIGGKRNVFRKRLNSHCKLVLRLSRIYLEAVAEKCGECSDKLFSEELRSLINKEIQEWKQES